MVISLDNEIAPYEPFGRSIIDSIPNHKITSKSKLHDCGSNDPLCSEESMFNNDFVTAELDLARDLFRSINEVCSSEKEKCVPVDFWKLRKSFKGEEEIYVKGNSIICSHKPSNNNGQSFLDKSFTFNENILDTVWCDFKINDNLSNVLKTFANEFKTFSASPHLNDNFKFDYEYQEQQSHGKKSRILKTLCVLDRYSIHIVSENGDFYRKKLPFQVTKMIALNYGLLFERAESESSHYPNIFSLSNPLNDPYPVPFVNGKLSQCPTNVQNLTFINIIREKNLAIFYCSKTKSHLVFYLRPITDCDLQQNFGEKKNMDLSSSSFNLATPETTKRQQQISGLTSSISRSINNNLINMIQQGNSVRNSSPLTSTTTNLNSPLQYNRHSLSNSEMNLKGVHSPSLKLSNLISSRVDSPVSPNLNRHQYSNSNNHEMEIFSHSDGHDSLNVVMNMSKNFRAFKTPNASFHSPTTSSIRTFDVLSQQKFYEPNVEFALEFVWSETSYPGSFISDTIASKVFVSCDFLGQNYLCFVVKNIMSPSTNSFLKLIRFDQVSCDLENNSKLKKSQYIFTNTKILSIKDAESLPSLNMIVILDETNTLVLYSGIYKVAIVHLQPDVCVLKSNLNEKVTMKFFTPKIKNDLKFQTPGQSFDAELFEFSPEIYQLRKKMYHASSPINDFLATSNKKFLYDVNHEQSSEKIDDDDLFSFSIQKNLSSFGEIINLRDPIDNRVTFQTDNSKLYRLSFPLIASTFIVDKCLAALRQTLPRDIILHFITTWYSYRNSTNTEEDIPEIILFKLCLFSSIGFDKDSIKKYYDSKNEIVSSNLTSGICSSFNQNESSIKKIKINDDDYGNDEDFFNLLAENNIDWINDSANNRIPNQTPVTFRKNSKTILKTEPFTCPDFLFPYIPHILYSIHLIYEDLKLVEMNWPLCKTIVDVLYVLAVHLELPNYIDHYFRDFWSICCEISMDIDPNFLENKDKIIYPPYFCSKPPSIYNTLYSLVSDQSTKDDEQVYFPYIGCDTNITKFSTIHSKHSIVTPNIFNMILLYSNLRRKEFIHPQLVLQHVGNNLHFDSNASAFVNLGKFEQITELYADIGEYENSTEKRTRDSEEKFLFLMSALGITQEYIKQLPFGLALPLWNVIFHFRMNPKGDWCSSIYSLIDRPDLLSLESQPRFSSKSTNIVNLKDENVSNFTEELEYVDNSVLRLLFPNDQRLHEAYRMLISCKPMVVNIKQEHGMIDNEFVEEQEKHLLALSFRAMALTVGRGMVTLRSYSPIVVERFPIPPLVLHGKIPPRHFIYMSHIDVPPNMNIWPLFHNGVSAGLRISSSPNKMVDSSWILLNKPSGCSSADDHYEHAGFLLALGLNGLLDNLSIMDLHDYLSKGNDFTKVAILLGLAASRRGTMDSTAFVLLGIHLEGLLPSTSTELDVSPIVRVAAVVGTGLLFQGTGNRYISEVMLNEIGRPPGPEMDHYIDRESYALSAGLAFGLVTLGRGNELMNVMISDGISIPNQLNHYMLGVHKKSSTIQKEKTKTPSYHIREGDRINADVTSPGATLALGMMFFDTGNKAIVQWLNVPDTQNLLEMVRPDFLLLRVLAKNLILWSDIKPTSQWIESHIPNIIYNHAFQRNNVPEKGLENELMFVDDIDYETMTQSYCNIIAGACFALALRYAGSADDEAFEVVYKYTYKLITLIQKGNTSQIEQAGRSTIESCVNILIVSCSIIMAGTGNVEIMRICRFLRSRVNQAHVLYGSFMAIHMALGLLFLGGCRMTLNSSPESVAALICAFFPKFPIHTNDNRYHLQAFRHLYVLASEPRLLIPCCIDTGLSLYATIRYTFKDKSLNPVEKMAPCLLPDLNLLETVELIDNNYWNISFQWDTNFDKLWNCLRHNGNLYIKRKIKCLSYNKEYVYNSSEANYNYGNSTSKFSFNKMNRKSFTLFDFTNKVILKTFSEVFNNNYCTDQELQMKNKICSILYECAEDETLDLFIPLIKLVALCSLMFKSYQNEQQFTIPDRLALKISLSKDRFQDSFCKYFIIWQIRLASHYLAVSNIKGISKYRIIETIRFQIESCIKDSVNKEKLRQYLEKDLPIMECDEILIDAIVYFNLPFEKLSIEKGTKFLNLIKSLRSSSKCIHSALFLCDIFK